MQPLFIDTHAHLDDRQFDADRDAVLDAAAAAGVGRVINIGYRPGIWETTAALARRRPEVSYTLGLHPHNADLWSDELARELRERLQSEPVVAIGETGLDFYRDWSPRDKQRQAFAGQLALGAELGLPVVIHLRDAEAELTEMLKDAPAGVACVLHSFDASPDLAELAFERGWRLGVGGIATRSSSRALRSILRAAPLASLVLETDSPYLAPAGAPSRRNEPAMIPRIAAALAQIRNEDAREVARQTTANAIQFFGLE